MNGAVETDALMGPPPKRTASRVPSIWTLIRQGGVVLDNEGSTARDHLANERTYLAWIRTSLSILGVGIGLLKWEGIANSAGYLTIALGVMVLVCATWRYLSVMQNLSEHRFEPNVQSALAVVAVILLIVLTLLVLQVMNKL